MAKQKTCVLTIPFVIGVVVLILGCVLGFVVFPNLLEDEVIENVVLNEDTLQWYRFKDIPFPINFKVYFFTILNPEQVVHATATPIVKELGPYVWSETRTKVIKEIKEDEIVYDELWKFEFNEEASGSRSDEDIITVVNAPLMAVLQNLEDLHLLPVPIETIIGEVLEDTNIFVPVKVKNYAFDGIKMCDPARTQNPYSMLVCLSIMLMQQKLLQYNDDRSIMFSLFGYKRNPDGAFTLKRGIKDINQLGLITKYKNEEYTNFWNQKESKDCDKVEGHYTTYPPFMEQDTSYKVYSTDICKGGILNYVGESSFKDVDAYRFQTDGTSFVKPEESCVCIDKTKGLDGEPHCFNEGVLDLNNCLGVPVILSFPHLMWAGENYQKSVDGMNNTYKDKHNTVIDFQPHLGFPLRGAIRIQFNLVLRPINYKGELVASTAKLPDALFPIIWLEDSFELTDTLIEEINAKLLNNLVLMDGVQWALIAIGIVLIVLAIGFCIFYQTRK